jgi:eukaryotic-like serine/threonine-protein kinase
LKDESKINIVGHSLLGHYRIVEKIGAGGMGEVYLAEDTRLRRKLALKVLPENIASDKERLRRFEQEAFAASALNHPNILTIYEFGAENDTHFLACEFVEGETLREKLNREGVSLNEALDIAQQTALALSAAHAAGIAHRDIKPENIMIRADGIIKVLDFGLAKLTEKPKENTDAEAETRALVQTNPGVVMGTVSYMSPEQTKGKDVDTRTDIWSLGVVLYEMLAGRLPFEGDTPNEYIASILKSDPLPLEKKQADFPAEIAQLVRKALRKDKDARYQTMKGLLADLKELREEIALTEKLERSAIPNRIHQTENQETLLTKAETTRDASQSQTASSAEYIVGEIKRHKSASFAALAILLLVIGGLGFWLFSNRSSNSTQIESIAVLPFQNASGNPDTEYLSDGIAESLINSLTELQQLKVIARSTAFRYKDKEVDPQTVGRDLNVKTVLMGRVRQIGDRLNIQVDLVDTSTGAQLWGENYERQVSDALSIKQTIAREVAERLRLRLSGSEQQQLVKRDTTNAEAYQFYLRGRYYWNKRTADGFKKAIEYFNQAIERDPAYALGYVGLADSYSLLADYADVHSSETLPKAKTAVERALQIDDSLAEAHASLANIYSDEWRWAEAEAAFRRAIALNPNYPTAHHWFSASYLTVKGRLDEALKEAKRAQDLDPLSPIISSHLANVYLQMNDVGSTIEHSQRVIELDPRLPNPYNNLGWAFFKQRRYEEAITEIQKSVELSGRSSNNLAALGHVYAIMGKRGETLQILKELEDRYVRREALGMNLASVYTGLGDNDQAFAWLEKDFQQRSGLLPQINSWTSFDAIRSDPRYADLVRRMGLEP